MNVQVLRKALGVWAVCSATLLATAQNTQPAATPKPMQWKQVPSWKSIQAFSVTLSPDGQWMAYAMMPVEGDGELIVQKVRDTVKRTYPVGSFFSGLQFSDDGKWLVFKEGAKDKERKAAAKMPGKQLFDKLQVVELATWKKTEYDKAGSYSFNGKQATHLAIQVVKERAMGARPDDPRGGDLLLVELSSGKNIGFGNVSEFNFNKEGNLLAYLTDAAGQNGNGIYIYDMKSRQVNLLDNDKASYRSLNWTEKGDGFAVLKTKKDEKFKSDKGSVVGVKVINGTFPVFTYDPTKDSANFPAGMTITTNRRPYWTDDLSRLIFGIAKLEPVKKEGPKTDSAKLAARQDSIKAADAARFAKIKADTSIKTMDDLQKALAKANPPAARPAEPIDTVKPDMAIWHWKDKRLQSRQQVMEMQDKNFNYISQYDVTSSKFTRLQDSIIRSLDILPKQLYALGEDPGKYEWDQNLDGQSYTDLYLVDLKTGVKTLLFEKLYYPSFTSAPRASWDGTKFLYGKDGQYYIYDMITRTSVNITEKVPTSFVNTEDDHNVKQPLTSLVGWSADNKYVLIRDLWDIWQIPVSGKEEAINLTQNGKQSGIRYQGRFQLDPEEKGIDLKKPQYLRIYGEWTKKSGIAKLEPGKPGLRPGAATLIWEDTYIGALRKADKAEVYVFSREKFNQPTEFFAADAQLKNEAQVSKNAPDKDKYTWSAGVQLVNYVSDKGDSLQGALFLPAGYEKGKKYPTVVYYYEKLSQTLHNWNNPGFSGTGWNPTLYTSNGYAVFIPDIVYKLDDPGMSAVWCVLPGVKAAIQTGVVDADKIGIHGHSWGGYQTAFLSTQTSMFKAAAAGAPLTNMVSMYDLIYWNSGGGNMAIFEASQGRFSGGPWENWESYLRNSPVYHVKKVTTPLLILHNDKDGAVDFTQGIEFYNALRRLKKPVVLVQYKGENHGLAKLENRKDYSVRMMEFFDYYLKGAPAPEWLKNGVDRLQLDEHLNTRAFDEQP
ncbi:MAG: prolyl oligopeptidase family serine peptidase [Chitinophagaceae bacterium]